MAAQTRTISDTKGFARVLVTLQNDSATTTVVDASGLDSHQSAAQTKIRHIEYALDGYVTLQFVKNSATAEKAITLAGSGIYNGGTITNSAGAATHATDGDIESVKEIIASMGMPEPLIVSSHTGEGIEELRETILYSLYGPKKTLIISEAEDGEKDAKSYVSQIYDLGIVTEKKNLEMTLWCGQAELDKLISKSNGRISIK